MSDLPRRRVIVLTCRRRGSASRTLATLAAHPRLEVAKVVLAHGGSPRATRTLRRKLLKMLRIGPLGALNGIRMRAWYEDREAPDLLEECSRLAVPLVEVPWINDDQTRAIFREADAELGVSLGNGYIAPSLFSIPRRGMINLHTEILPELQGAQSVIWAIHQGWRETGFTIHQVAKAIDAGDILHQERYPIEFEPTLQRTVERMLRVARSRFPAAIAMVCADHERLAASSRPQSPGRAFTTPSWWAFRRMVDLNARGHRETRRERLSRGAQSDAATEHLAREEQSDAAIEHLSREEQSDERERSPRERSSRGG